MLVKKLYGDGVPAGLRERLKRVCKEEVRYENWFQVAKLAAALRDGEFDEPVCVLCDRFCYESSYDYEVCPKTAAAIELMDDLGVMPEEVEWGDR